MKITMYELLGLLKDGKAPKKIYYNRNVYRLNIYKHYIRTEIYTDKKLDLLDDLRLQDDFLNEEVEILEEEKKIPEKLDISNGISVVNCAYKINEIIDYLEYFKSKGDE